MMKQLTIQQNTAPIFGADVRPVGFYGYRKVSMIASIMGNVFASEGPPLE